ncbi:hypothetical protein V493_04638 [Pseudogymnoascus sp. VKM F-4281 (FW-2241)]|nr:hypothetical protein V493_04638 [Pseudogymnoascus sp. VKM F-4281 (FW-2241)]
MTPRTGFADRLKSISVGAEEEAPLIRVRTATALLVFYTFLYVVPFYISPVTRPSPGINRNIPSVIKARIRSVTWTCAMCTISTALLLAYLSTSSTYLTTLHLMGYHPAGLLPSLRALLLTAILFLGPLFESGIVEGNWRSWSRLRGITTLWHDLPTFRNLVAGPITEELLFRSASLPIFLLSPASLRTTFLVPPLVFGLAHFHHIYEFRISNPSAPLLLGVIRSVIQLMYTTLFGSYATFVYLRTGSLLAVILCHTFCNWMGLPRFWGRVEGGGAESVMGPDSGGDQGKRGDSQGSESAAELGILWTIAYYTILVVGAVGFYRYLWLLTESDNRLLDF